MANLRIEAELYVLLHDDDDDYYVNITVVLKSTDFNLFFTDPKNSTRLEKKIQITNSMTVLPERYWQKRRFQLISF